MRRGERCGLSRVRCPLILSSESMTFERINGKSQSYQIGSHHINVTSVPFGMRSKRVIMVRNWVKRTVDSEPPCLLDPILRGLSTTARRAHTQMAITETASGVSNGQSWLFLTKDIGIKKVRCQYLYRTEQYALRVDHSHFLPENAPSCLDSLRNCGNLCMMGKKKRAYHPLACGSCWPGITVAKGERVHAQDMWLDWSKEDRDRLGGIEQMFTGFILKWNFLSRAQIITIFF